jgi:hypothetical protein
MSWVITGASKAPLTLDAYPGAAAAYSLRQLSWAYGDPVVRVRRSSDSVEADFTATQVADGSLVTWVGAGNNGFVQTWYDQTKAGNHAIQTDAALQPRVVNAGSLVTHENKPGVSFTGGLVRLNADHLRNRSRLDAYIVKNTSDTDYIIFSGGNISFSWVSISGSSSTSDLRRNYGVSSVLYANGSLFTGTTRGDIFTLLNGYKLEVHQASATNVSWSFFDIGCYNRSTGADFVGTVQELIFYASDQSANRTGIQSSINNHYAIY